jgi:hypothetical protein
MSEEEPDADSEVKTEAFEDPSNWQSGSSYATFNNLQHPSQHLAINTGLNIDGPFDQQSLQSSGRPRSAERVPIPPATSAQQLLSTGPMSSNIVVPPR